MTISRRQLYALGEPFGASATMRQPGAGIHYGAGDGPETQSNPVTTNADKRVAVSDGMGISGDGSSVHTTSDYSTNIYDSRRTDNSSRYLDTSEKDYSTNIADSRQTDNSSRYSNSSRTDNSTNIADSRQTNTTDSRQWTDTSEKDYSTNIADSRQTNSTDSRQWADNSVYTDNSNSSDAIKAMTDAGAAIIRSSGESVVDLARFQGAQNTDAWNSTLSTGATLIDKLIDKTSEGFALSAKVVDSFTPTETKQADTGKYAMIAAAVSVALFAGNMLLKAKK